MHNFVTVTCTTMASDPAVRQLLRTTAVHMAVGCEYIMRSILAVSALHLARYRPREKDLYIRRALQHHQAASSVAIDLMTDLRVEECERLHIFSMLTIYYGASLFLDPYPALLKSLTYTGFQLWDVPSTRRPVSLRRPP